MPFDNSLHPRDARSRFVDREHSIPELFLIPPTTQFDLTKLTKRELKQLEAYLLEMGHERVEDLYSGEYASVAQEIIYLRRGMAPKLEWVLQPVDGELPSAIIPAVVAKAVTAEDLTNPTTVLQFETSRAFVAKEKAVEARARKSGRVDGEGFAKLRDREHTTLEAHVVVNAKYTAAAAMDAADAVEKFLTAGTSREIAVAYDVAYTAKEAAVTAAQVLDTWFSEESVGFRNAGFLTKAWTSTTGQPHT
jgi:hypothetical protein